MLFRVDPSSATGLADQIAAQVRGALVAGRLQPGEKLAPARHVAAGLDVNMHTVLRAYQTLRDEGLIDLRRGRGAVVRPDANPPSLALDDAIHDLARAAVRIGWSAQQAGDAVRAAVDEVTGREGAEPSRQVDADAGFNPGPDLGPIRAERAEGLNKS